MPPQSSSLPPRPWRLSSPSSPQMTSLPGVPVRTSLPAVPLIVHPPGSGASVVTRPVRSAVAVVNEPVGIRPGGGEEVPDPRPGPDTDLDHRFTDRGDGEVVGPAQGERTRPGGGGVGRQCAAGGVRPVGETAGHGQFELGDEHRHRVVVAHPHRVGVGAQRGCGVDVREQGETQRLPARVHPPRRGGGRALGGHRTVQRGADILGHDHVVRPVGAGDRLVVAPPLVTEHVRVGGRVVPHRRGCR